MVCGIINPSGVDLNRPPPALVQALKAMSPFRFAIEALCLGEYPGMEFHRDQKGGWFQTVRNLPRMGAMAMVQNGDQVIEALGLQHQTYSNAMKELAILSVEFWGLSWLGLQVQQMWSRRRPSRRSKKAKQSKGDMDADTVEHIIVETIEDTLGEGNSRPLVNVPVVRRI
mmetsp:Transcript_21081/g.44051  ORF Transcript_21081/g.44051 Transcript_21081/m.44051 type:complete len:170 (+) Transcript_21081:1540-2049(+)